MVGIRRRRSTGCEEEPVERERKIVRRNTELPQDVITDILKRLPVRSLIRFKYVCKLWYNLFTSSDFVSMHSTHNSNKFVSLFIDTYRSPKGGKKSSKTLTILFRFSDVSYTLTHRGPEGHVELLGCANGLVCLSLSGSLGRHNKFLIWNPATKETGLIPGCEYQPGSPFGFCFDSTENSFKMSCLTFYIVEEGVNKAHIQTFTSCSAKSSWVSKDIDFPTHILVEKNLQYRTSGVPCVNDKYMYWNIFATVYVVQKGFIINNPWILCFDMVGEVFKRIEYPHLDSTPRSTTKLVPYKRSLALLACYGFHVDVWVMDDDQSWRILLAHVPTGKELHPLGLFIKDDNYSVAVHGSRDIVLSISETGDSKKISTAKKIPRVCRHDFFVYTESLFPVR